MILTLSDDGTPPLILETDAGLTSVIRVATFDELYRFDTEVMPKLLGTAVRRENAGLTTPERFAAVVEAFDGEPCVVEGTK